MSSGRATVARCGVGALLSAAADGRGGARGLGTARRRPLTLGAYLVAIVERDLSAPGVEHVRGKLRASASDSRASRTHAIQAPGCAASVDADGGARVAAGTTKVVRWAG